jgi:predicted PolB exonuclease-like 3'-5' exonuclease
VLKFLADEVWAFDAEWVPDPNTGRRVYSLDAELPDEEVLQHMWKKGGATEEDPTPYLKTILCRVVSVSVLIRKKDRNGTVTHKLHSIPSLDQGAVTEKELLDRFLSGVGKAKPQLVGYNSLGSDLPIMIQRSLVNQVFAPAFCARPSKPWEGVDYFARGSDHNIDLKDLVSSWGRGTPSLHEVATACGIPGKMDTSGEDVVKLWREGNLKRIVEYNECDALTTFLLWLRVVHLAGLITTADHHAEQNHLRRYLEEQATHHDRTHLTRYLEVWSKLMESGRANG